MRTTGIKTFLLAVVLQIGCRGSDSGDTAFRDLDADPVPVTVLMDTSLTAEDGRPAREIHVLLPRMATEDAAQVTLMHVIDSITGVDPDVFWIRITGFKVPQPAPGKTSTLARAVIKGTWGPVDTARARMIGRKAKFRSNFVISGFF